MYDAGKCARKLQEMMDKHWYSSAKNIADWCMNDWAEDREEHTLYALWVRADAAMHLGDCRYALSVAENLCERHPDYYPEIMRNLTERCRREIEKTEAKQQENALVCEDERLYPILRRLLYVFDKVNKPVRVFVSEDEAHYEAFFRKQFKGEEIAPYDEFQATGVYYDDSCYWLVFKKDVMAQQDDGELLGMCAHEMAHLELVAKGTTRMFSMWENYRDVDMHINERLTDLYVIAKGFALPLYRSRKKMGAASCVISAEEIESIVEKMMA